MVDRSGYGSFRLPFIFHPSPFLFSLLFLPSSDLFRIQMRGRRFGVYQREIGPRGLMAFPYFWSAERERERWSERINVEFAIIQEGPLSTRAIAIRMVPALIFCCFFSRPHGEVLNALAFHVPYSLSFSFYLARRLAGLCEPGGRLKVEFWGGS